VILSRDWLRKVLTFDLVELSIGAFTPLYLPPLKAANAATRFCFASIIGTGPLVGSSVRAIN